MDLLEAVVHVLFSSRQHFLSLKASLLPSTTSFNDLLLVKEVRLVISIYLCVGDRLHLSQFIVEFLNDFLLDLPGNICHWILLHLLK